MTDLIKAAEEGNIKLVQKLLDEGVDINAEDGMALYRAIANKHLEMVNFLLDNGAKVPQEHSEMPLYAAAKNGWDKLVKRLVKAGANANPEHGLPLINAIKSNSPEIVEYLIEQGASVENPDILVLAIRSKNSLILETVLQNGGKAYVNSEIRGVMPLVYARAIRSHKKALTTLLKKYGAKVMAGVEA